MASKVKAQNRGKGVSFLTALAANAAGEIIEVPGYAAVGMDGDRVLPLTLHDTLPMPHGSELMLLPHRRPVLLNLASGRLEVLAENPFSPGEPLLPVAVFNSPGYVLSRVSAHEAPPDTAPLPLFSYGALGWGKGGFRSAAIRVDREPRQDLRRMPREKVVAGVERLRRILPENRLCRHLETCALTYGCPAGKNFFLGRYEAPLPTARQCNARCLGCLSLQRGSKIHCSQERIAFTPSPEEIAEVALHHINRVKRAVVSFGQGCEGEPLLAARVIAPAIRLIREKTPAGTVHLNTNGSLPGELARLFDEGLDSIRVSMNSVRKPCYTAYFRPEGYRFEDVLGSIDLALSRGRFVAVNYLSMPGFTDTEKELAALERFVREHPVHMIEWRNLNFDPLVYLSVMRGAADGAKVLAMAEVLHRIRAARPDIRYGYFNPPKESWTPAEVAAGPA